LLKHYLIVSLRNISRHKWSAIINIGGLSLGMVCCILILLFVQQELSYDKFHEKNEQIYRLVLERKGADRIKHISSPALLAPTLKNDFPQIINSVRFFSIDNPAPVVSNGKDRFYEKQFYFADKDIFNVFTIPFIEGNSVGSLDKPNSVVITEDAAKKYFGEQSPIGKTLTVNNSIDLEITGVIKNLPSNSTLKFDFLASFEALYPWIGKEFINNWQNYMCQSFVLLPKNYNVESLTNEFPQFISRHLDKSTSLKRIYLQPLDRIHLYSSSDYNISSGGDINYTLLLTAIAIFVLLIACFNYLNLTSTQFIYRLKDVGIRKIIGARLHQLVFQFLIESLFLLAIVLLLSSLIVLIILPFFNSIIGRDINIDILRNWKLLFCPIAFVILVGVLSGIYPVYLFFSSKSILLLKGNISNGFKRTFLKKSFIIVQFALTSVLVTGIWIVYSQMNYLQSKSLGFEGSRVLVVPIRNEGLRQNPSALKNQLLKQRGVLSVGAAALLPGGPVGKAQYHIDGTNNIGILSMLWVDHDFIKTLGLDLLAGRDFSTNFTTDASQSFIINEEAVNQLGYKSVRDAIGKPLNLSGRDKGTIIGVVKNFHLTSLHHKIEPLVMYIWPWMNYILIRLNNNNINTAIPAIKNTFNEFDPINPVDFRFLNDSFLQFYESERHFEMVSGIFTFFAILIAGLGLFNLAKFTSEKRTKEIGIRKVLGASFFNILNRQLREYFILILLSNLIAWPIAYIVMTKWLQSFAYRVNISIGTFFYCCIITFLVAFITVIYHTAKSAFANPIESIRYE